MYYTDISYLYIQIVKWLQASKYSYYTNVYQMKVMYLQNQITNEYKQAFTALIITAIKTLINKKL